MYLKWQLLIVGFLLSFQLLGQVSLEGTVKGKNQANLENVAVVLLPGNQGTVTDKNGFFQFNDLSAGDYVLQFSLLGYGQREQKVTVSEAGSVLETIQMEANPFVMDEVLVNAIRAGEKTPMTYTNINKMQLEEQNLGQDVPVLLRWTPSAIVTSDAGAGIGYTGIRIRGSDPTRINVTINGIPLNDAESQGVFWVNMPDFVSSTDNIQVQRGVGTSSNGAGAFGATINMNTAKVNQDASASINTSVGSFNTFRRNVQFGTGLINERFVIDGRLSKITSDGYIDRASSDLSSYFVSAAYVGDRTTLRFNTFAGHEITYQAWNGVPADMVDDRETRTFNSAGLEKPGEPHNNEVDDYTQRHYQLHFNQQLSARTNANIALHYTQGFGFFEQYKADQDLADYGRSNPDFPDAEPDLIRRRWLDNDFYGLVYSLNTSKNKVDFTIGGGYNIYEGRHFGEVIWSELAFGQDPSEPYYDNDGRKTDFNVYSKLSYAFNPKLEGYLDLQFRQVGYEFLGFDINRNNVTQTDDLSFFNPKLGLHYEISDQSSAYASFAVANREPNRNDYVESTPASRPSHEQLYDTELGYRYNGKKAAFEATAYYMYYIDQLALNGQINDVGAATRINIDESYRLGLELNGGYQISKQLDLQAGATFSSNKVIAFDEFVDTYLDDGGFEQTMVSHEDTDLAFSPNVIASFGVNWKPFAGAEWMGAHDLNVSLLNKYISRQFIDNTSDENNVIDPYTFTDLRINLSLKKVLVNEIEISLLVQNVFDALYEANAWSYRYIAGGSTFVDRGLYPQATRNFLLGVNLKF